MLYSSTRLQARRRQPREVATGTGSSRRHRPDYVLLIIMSALLMIGAVVVYAIGPGLTNGKDLPENYYSSKQLTAIFLGVIGFLVAAAIPVEKWKRYQWPVIGLAAVIAIAVRFVGEEINGAHRWIQVSGFSFQAAELIKLAIVLWVAYYLANKRREGAMQRPEILKVLGILAVCIYVVVAALQSDLGSAAVMLSIVGVLAAVAGLPLKKIAIVAVVAMVLGFLAIVSTPYRRERVVTFFNPTADCQAEGYQACQALITIGSGGLFGKGLGRSVQAYGYLPEPANDSIFAIVSEKFGFVGSLTVVVLFWILFKRIADIARAAPSDYSRLLVTGVLVWLSVQMIINVGAMIGLLPLKGITLPFVSYGGTSIIFVMVAMGIVFQVSRHTDLAVLKQKRGHRESSTAAPVTRYRRGAF